MIKAKLQAGWEKAIPTFPTDKPVATRNAGQQVMNAIEKVVPELFGGAADLTASTKTIFKDSPSFHVDPTGRNVFFGVREFGMMAMVNGMAAHGGMIPFGSTFFVFSDYCRPALRLGALMCVHSLYVFTHDSVGLGEDGPTHQPIEHLMSLRAIPQMTDFRPADANETAACWKLALERKSASFMALSRQDLPVFDAALTFAGPAEGRLLDDAGCEEGGRDSDRDGLRGYDLHEGCRGVEGRGDHGEGGVDAELQDLRRADGRRTRRNCCRRRRRRFRLRRARPWAGGSMSATTAR